MSAQHLRAENRFGECLTLVAAREQSVKDVTEMTKALSVVADK